MTHLKNECAFRTLKIKQYCKLERTLFKTLFLTAIGYATDRQLEGLQVILEAKQLVSEHGVIQLRLVNISND
jgi:hypothetical protein